MKAHRKMRFVFAMKLQDYLVVGMGRVARDHTVSLVLHDTEMFGELIGLIQSGSKTQRMKGSWVLSGVGAINPHSLRPHYACLLECLELETVGGVKRELLRCFDGIALDKLFADQLIMVAMNWVTDERQDLAVRYICFRLLTQLLKEYPELQIELNQQIDFYRSKFGKFP